MKKITKLEKIMWVCIVAVSLCLFLAYFLFAEKGKVVEVKVSGKVIATYSLNENREMTIEGYKGQINVLVIEDRRAYMKSAECPDKLCVNQGKISTVGQSIVCLPGRIVVTVKKGDGKSLDEDESVDAIVK